MLACPYHAWVYDLDGRLHSARKMGPSFDTSEHGLPQVHLRTLEGLIFVCLAEEPPGFDEVEQTLAASLGHYGWKSARIAHREVYSVDANWKLTTENYLECYHCAPAHPEFARHHASEKPPEEVATLRAEAAERARAQGIEIPERFNWPAGSAPNQEGVSCSHDATYPGSVTGSEDGLSVAPLMGDFKDYDGGFTYLEVGVASFFLAYPDHGMMYLFIPRAPQKTDMEILWLVGGDTQEGVDYDLERLTFMWHATSIEDKRIIDQNQKGVNSRYYKPGPYGPMEDQARCFAEWYLEQIAPHASEDG
jgi:Rieske 2Fe-2S family protein